MQFVACLSLCKRTQAKAGATWWYRKPRRTYFETTAATSDATAAVTTTVGTGGESATTAPAGHTAKCQTFHPREFAWAPCDLCPQVAYLTRADFEEGDEDRNFHFSESSGSLNGPDLFIELPSKPSLKGASSHPSPKNRSYLITY